MADQSQGQASQARPSNEDIISVLIATDNHLGYLERDPVRGNDSFAAFEEILIHAAKQNVDFLLLGGDLFHENKPSRNTLHKTMVLIRKYCFGEGQIKFKIVSDQAVNFPNEFQTANFEDPYYKVKYPIFSIHGNHDDPAGDGGLAALDLLSVCNFVNYFGKSTTVDDVAVHPILITKGKSKVAIYGLGNIRDERLNRTFSAKKVRFVRDMPEPDSWFSILVLHQNRIAHAEKNYVHEDMLGDFFDFVVWGHEHECKIQPVKSAIQRFFISQPGSSVATSLSEFEAKQKHIGVLQINSGQFRMRPYALRTVRPFEVADVSLSMANLDPAKPEEITRYLTDQVQNILTQLDSVPVDPKVSNMLGAIVPDPKMARLPLIRLKVEYTGFDTISAQRFGQQFVGKVANPNEILLFYRRKTSASIPKAAVMMDEDELLERASRIPEPLNQTDVSDLITSFLGEDLTAGNPSMLHHNGFQDALHKFVAKEDGAAIEDFVQKVMTDTRKYLVSYKEREKTTKDDDLQSVVFEYVAKKKSIVKTEDTQGTQAKSSKKPALSATSTPVKKSSTPAARSTDPQPIKKLRARRTSMNDDDDNGLLEAMEEDRKVEEGLRPIQPPNDDLLAFEDDIPTQQVAKGKGTSTKSTTVKTEGSTAPNKKRKAPGSPDEGESAQAMPPPASKKAKTKTHAATPTKPKAKLSANHIDLTMDEDEMPSDVQQSPAPSPTSSKWGRRNTSM